MATVNDFFCGAGGMGIGFKQAGFQIRGAWDFDKYAVESYHHNVGDHVQQMDITKMSAADVPDAEVWTYGFPCQDLSKASGSPKGLFKGKRSRLFFEVMRLLDEMEDSGREKPVFIMAENVRGLRKYLPVLREEYNKRGYRMVYTLYNSRFWGVPQNRERYFVVGIRSDHRKAFNLPVQGKEEIPLKTILEPNVDDKYFIDDEKNEVILEKFNLPHGEPTAAPIRYLNRNQRNFGEVALCVDTGNTNGVAVPVFKVRQATKLGYDIASDGDSINLSHPKSKTRRGRVGKQIAQTILTAPEQCVVVERKIRYFTPRETARLQGFPDDYEIVVPERQFYKLMGNAVTGNVSKAIADQIRNYLEKYETGFRNLKSG